MTGVLRIVCGILVGPLRHSVLGSRVDGTSLAIKDGYLVIQKDFKGNEKSIDSDLCKHSRLFIFEVIHISCIYNTCIIIWFCVLWNNSNVISYNCFDWLPFNKFVLQLVIQRTN
jgi:hypothetical protein